jgi:hypothetical protein
MRARRAHLLNGTILFLALIGLMAVSDVSNAHGGADHGHRFTARL